MLTIQTSETSADTIMPIVQRDKLLYGVSGAPSVAGMKYLFDFQIPYSNPNAAGSLVSGAPFLNLVAGGAAGSAYINGGGIVSSAAGLDFNGAGDAAIDVGSAYDMHALSHDWLVSFWFKQSASMTTAYAVIAGLTTNSSSSNDQWSVDIGSGGANPRATLGGSTISFGGAFSTSVATHIAVALQSGTAYLFKNGALVTSQTGVTIPSPPANTHEGYGRVNQPGVPLYINSGFSPPIGRFYRAFKEDLTVSAVTTLAGIQARLTAEYNANVARMT